MYIKKKKKKNDYPFHVIGIFVGKCKIQIGGVILVKFTLILSLIFLINYFIKF